MAISWAKKYPRYGGYLVGGGVLLNASGCLSYPIQLLRVRELGGIFIKIGYTYEYTFCRVIACRGAVAYPDP